MEFWFNLPVKNIRKSVDFFTEMGFILNPHNPVTDTMASFFIGEKKVVMMLFREDILAGFSGNQIADTTKGTEVLFSIDAESPDAVNVLLQKAEKAGGYIYAKG